MYNLAYNLILSFIVAPIMILLYGPKILLGRKYRDSIKGKLGILDDPERFKKLPGPRIWFHAVSVGEVVALGSVIDSFREIEPDVTIVVSTGTETGQAKARETLESVDAIFYMPLDFIFTVRSVIDTVRPDMFVIMETEIWPNLLHILKRRSTKIVLANGRISDRSLPGYLRLRRFFKPTLNCVDLFLMSSNLDSQRIQKMGAEPKKVMVTGNTKIDAAFVNPENIGDQGWLKALELDDSPVFVLGSVHPQESRTLLNAYKGLLKKYPDMILIIAPRHVEKTSIFVSHIKAEGLEEPDLLSQLLENSARRKSGIIILDLIGKLFTVYSIASVVFMGGSLAPKGGQNIIEPAAWGKFILFGPSMEDFREAKAALLRCSAAVEVETEEDIVKAVDLALSDPERTKKLGQMGRDAIMKHAGSSQKTAVLISAALNWLKKA